MILSLQFDDEVADCAEEPGAWETNALNQPAGYFWRPVTMAVSFSRQNFKSQALHVF
jgi:hypothetical protein